MSNNIRELLKKYLPPIPINVLLIDDEFLIGEAMRLKLASEKDICFSYCQEPVQAIQKIMEIRPSVILQDLVMPGVNGLEMVKALKAKKGICEIPLIVLSAREEPELKQKAYSLGADDYMVKLPDKIELISKIKSHSERYICHKQRNEAILKLHKYIESESA